MIMIPGAGPIEIARIISIGPGPASSCINRDYASARRGSVGYPPGGPGLGLGTGLKDLRLRVVSTPRIRGLETIRKS